MTAALPAHAHRQRQLALLLSRQPLTTAEAAARLGISTDNTGHVLRRLAANGYEVQRVDPFELAPHWRVLYPKGRVCAVPGCGTILRRTNTSDRCDCHSGAGAPGRWGWGRKHIDAVHVADALTTTVAKPESERDARAMLDRLPPEERSCTYHDGAEVRAARERCGLGLRALASSAGISPGCLSHIERGQRGLTPAMSRRLEAAIAAAPAKPPAVDGAELRAARLARGLSLRQYAAQVGLSPGFVSRLENGQRVVTPAIAKRLGTSESTLAPGA